MRFSRSLSIVVIGGLTLAACGGDRTDSSRTSPIGSTESPDQTATATSTSDAPSPTASRVETTTTVADTAGPDDTTSPAETIEVGPAIAALELAAETVTGEPYAIGSDDHDGRDVWEVELAANGTSVTVWVSLDGTEIVDQERDDDPDDEVEMLQSVEVSAVDALQTIAPLFSGTFDELELDTRGADVVWEIEIDRRDRSRFDIIVDAVTGAILEVSDGAHDNSTVTTSDLAGFVEYERIGSEVEGIDELTAIVETDNPNSRVIIFFEDGNRRPLYKSVFVKDQNRLKLIVLDGGGVLVDETL